MKRIKALVVAVAISAALFGTAVPAFAAQCENPRGNHNGWMSCPSGCCERPRGNANGWELCDPCCINPRGNANGWAACD